MKVFMFFMLVAAIHLSANSYSQTTKISLDMNNVTIKQVLQEIENQSEFRFLYSDSKIDVEQKVNVNIENSSIQEIFKTVFDEAGINYEIRNRQILLSNANPIVALQNIKVTGKVTDITGQALPGVTVVVKGTTNGTITNFDGLYTLSEVPSNGTIQFSFVGMRMQEIEIEGKSSIDVMMEEDAIGIEEVVAIGYGTMRKSDLTGAISSVDVSSIEESGATNLLQSVQGRVSGINVTSNSGVPGSIGSITIRGTSSMSTSSQPLYVIDGLLIDADPVELGEQTPVDPLQSLSPEDIQSIEVLKDASATAIYGARGANGVILITTKQANKGEKGKIRYNGSFGISQITRKLDVLDANQYGQFINEMLELGASSSVFSTYETDENGDIIMNEGMQSHDWQDEYFVPAFSTNHRLSFTEGKANKTTYISGGILSADGVIKNTGMKKYDFRANYSTEVKKWLKISTNTAAALVENKYTVGATNTAKSSIMRSIYLTRPLLSNNDVTEDGDINDEFMVGTLSSPDAWIKGHQNDNLTKTLNTSLSLDLSILPFLKLKSRVGLNYSDYNSLTYFSRNLSQGRYSNGLAGKYTQMKSNFLWDNLFLYDFNIKKDHRFHGTFGVTFNRNYTQKQKLTASDFVDDTQLANAIHSAVNSSIDDTFKYQYSYLSFLGRVNYNYLNKLLVTTTFRLDGVSKFAKGNKWGMFPSLSAAYNLHEESFLKGSDILSRFKIRAGWGIVGNSPSPVYATVSQFQYVRSSDAEGNAIMSIVPTTKGNPELSWESLEQTNLGFDFGFLNNKLNIGVDLYYKMTKNQIQNVPLPTESGFASIWMNRGSVENKGIDIELNTSVYKNSYWNIDLGGTFSLNRNQILNLGLASDDFGRIYFESAQIGKADGFMTSPNVYMEGAPIGAFWGYKTDGVIYDEADADQSPTFNGTQLLPGDIKFVDLRGAEGNVEKDGNVSPEDKEILGDPNPDFTYSLRADISYKKFFMNFLFTGAYGFEVLNANNLFLQNMNERQIAFNKLKENYLHAWRPDAPNTEYPRLMQNVTTVSSVITDRMIEDGSFLKLGQLTVGYSFKMPKVGDFRVYVTGNNLVYLTKYSGYSPEVQTRRTNRIIGVDLYNFPDAKSVMLGVNFTF